MTRVNFVYFYVLTRLIHSVLTIFASDIARERLRDFRCGGLLVEFRVRGSHLAVSMFFN